MTIAELRAKILELTTALDAGQTEMTTLTTQTNTAVAAEAEATAALAEANQILKKHEDDKMPIETINAARVAVAEATTAL